MTDKVVLDSGPLGMLANPKADANREINTMLSAALVQGVEVYLPEIADHEVRRSLLKIDTVGSVERLDALKETLRYLPINTLAMLKAENLWAGQRKRGKPTADDKALDGDVILMAQLRKWTVPY